MTPQVARRRRAIVIAAAAALAVLVAVVAARALGGGGAPAEGALKFAPKDALVWVHLSTDRDRDAVKDARELAGRFDAYERFRDAIVQRLAGTGGRVEAEDVEPWLGDEVALALVDGGNSTAGSLVVARVTDEAAARRFLERNPRRSAVRRYKGRRIDEYGPVNVAFEDGFLLIGQDRTVTAALDRANGDVEDLTDDRVWQRASEGRPEGRVVDAYATADGLRRLLVPQGAVLGTLATLLDQPALQGVNVTMEPDGDGARVRAHTALDATAQGRAGRTRRAFEPALTGAVPAQDTIVYLGTRGISGALGNLVTAAAGGAQAGGVGPLLQRLRSELSKQTGGALERDLLGLLDGEVAVVIGKAAPAPTLALVTDVESEDRTANVLRRLQAPLARLLTPRGEAAPRWRSEDIGDGVRAATLATPAGAEVSYAVLDGRLVLGTSAEAVKRIKDSDDGLDDAGAFEDVTEGRPDEVTSLGFLDFSQLLELGEQTGLNDSREYLAARDDLRRIRAVGVSSTGDEGETTAEILLSIP